MNNFLITIKECGAYYSKIGKSPIIAYHGYYIGKAGEKKNFVGNDYFNMTRVDERPDVLKSIAKYLIQDIRERLPKSVDFFCGAPLGGYNLAIGLGFEWLRIMEDNSIKAIKAEKKVFKIENQNNKEETELFFGRHSIIARKKYAIVEDVCNNFSTTQELIDKIQQANGTVSAIICIVNRSMKYHNFYYDKNTGDFIPIFSRIYFPMQQFRQDDPKVIEDVLNNNICFNPKAEWDKLLQLAKNQ